MKTKLIVAAALTLMTASCSKESVIESDLNKAGNAISFTSYTSALTKGNPIDNNTEFIKDGNTFGVTAFISGTPTSPYMGYAGKGAEIKTNGSIWNYANANEQAYWPTGAETLDFYAYSPFGNDAITQAFDKTTGLTINYSVPAEEANQVDLMFAEAKDEAKADPVAAVVLPFKHALTQVHFGIATKTDRLKIDVEANGIDLNRIMGVGKFAASTEVWSDFSNSTNYTVTSDAITAGYEFDAEANPVVKYAKIGTDDAALMLLPQTFEATTIDETTGAVGDAGSYLTISCRIYQMLEDDTKVYLHGAEAIDGASGFVDIKVPFSSKGIVADVADEVWKRNNKVTYNLLIGAGTAGGLDPITFTTTVEEWLPADGGVVEN